MSKVVVESVEVVLSELMRVSKMLLMVIEVVVPVVRSSEVKVVPMVVRACSSEDAESSAPVAAFCSVSKLRTASENFSFSANTSETWLCSEIYNVVTKTNNATVTITTTVHFISISILIN